MVCKESNIKWAVSMNSKAEEETQKSHNRIRYTEYFASEKFTLKQQQQLMVIHFKCFEV